MNENFEQILKENMQLNLANSKSRITNAIIDTLFFYFLYYVLICFSWSILKIDSEEDPFIDLTLLFSASMLTYIATESLFQKTLGKVLTRTKVVNTNGEKPSFRQVLGRTFCRLIPCEAFSFLFLQNGIHDKFTNTRVVND